jgi:hypothetical protein
MSFAVNIYHEFKGMRTSESEKDIKKPRTWFENKVAKCNVAGCEHYLYSSPMASRHVTKKNRYYLQATFVHVLKNQKIHPSDKQFINATVALENIWNTLTESEQRKLPANMQLKVVLNYEWPLNNDSTARLIKTA